jgi:WD40 repeat protein
MFGREMVKSRQAAWLSTLLLILITGCGRDFSGRPTPTLPPFPYLSPTPSRTPLVFVTPTSHDTATPTPLSPQAIPIPQFSTPDLALATPEGYIWPTPMPTRAHSFTVNTLTPIAPGSRLEALSEVMRLGHGTLLYFAFSDDGRWLGFSTQRGIEVYDARTLSPVLFIATPFEILRLVFSPDGAILAAADRDSRLSLYATTDGSLIRQLDNGALGPPLTLTFFAGGSLLHIGTSSEISVIWEVETGKLAHRWYTSGNAAMAASSDGVLMATSNWNGSIFLWTLQDGNSPGRLWANSEILAMQFAPDSSILLAGYGDDTAIIWNLEDAKVLHTLRGHTDRVTTVAISPDSRLAATGSWDNTIRLWDIQSGLLLQTLTGHSGRIVQIAFTPDGRGLASYAEDGRFQFLTVPAGIPTKSLNDFAPPGNAIYTPDGKIVLTGAQDGWLRWWNAENGAMLAERLADPAGISALQLSPDGSLIATGGTDGPIRLWAAATGQLIAEYNDSHVWVNNLAFSPDGHWLAAGGAEGNIRLWDMTSGRLDRTIDTGLAVILRLAFSPDSRQLAGGALDGSVTLWQIDSHLPPRILREKGPFVSALAFSPDGYTLASGGDEKTISLWRLVGGGLTLTPESQRPEGSAAVAFTPDGQVLVASFWDHSLRFYSPASGSLLVEVDLPFTARQISISPDGRQLALSLEDGTVRLWAIH